MIENRKELFLVEFERLRKRRPALKSSRLRYETWKREYASDSSFAQKYDLALERINSTKLCSTCGFVGDPRLFINLCSSHTRTGRCKQCHSARQVKSVNTMSGRLSKILADARKRDPSAKNIRVSDFRRQLGVQGNTCFYTGLDMSFDSKDGIIATSNNLFSNLISIDRLDSSKGYTTENIVFCCYSVNVMKSSLPYGTFVEICKRIIDHDSQHSSR